ncbi:MAG: Periplasmic nitrate reductase, electron transfer subunit [Verrucomicrobiota bacterium]|jgi:nitrate reductase cytochrome c-type subunit
MNHDPHLGRRLFGIAVFLGLSAVAVAYVGESIVKPKILPPLPVLQADDKGPLPTISPQDREALRQDGGRSAAAPAEWPEGAPQRDLATVYSRRAYHGAPPVIPHAVDNALEIKQNCNSCHEKGGFVPNFKAFAPVTPHPQYENCLQCHAMAKSSEEFSRAEGPSQKNLWTSPKPPLTKQLGLASAPPKIPHSLHLRDKCLACHDGPAAPVEIRCPHPERGNCLQCHAQSVDSNGLSHLGRSRKADPFRRSSDAQGLSPAAP